MRNSMQGRAEQVVTAGLLIAAVFGRLIGCGSQDIVAPGSFTMQTPQALSVLQGESRRATITVSRNGSFTGSVILAASGQPTGVTVSFDAGTIAAGDLTGGLTVEVDYAVALGQYPIVITGRGSGVPTQTVTLTLNVMESRSLFLVVKSNSFTVVPGGAAETSTVTVNRVGGFPGDVHLAISGTTPGITATLSSNTIGANSYVSTIRVSASAAASPGTGALTVTAWGTGNGETSATLTFGIASTSASGVTLMYCGFAPTALFTSDGDKNVFRMVRPISGTTYTLSFPSGRGALVTVNPTASVDTHDVTVIYGSVADFRAYNRSLACSNTFDDTVSGTVAGLNNGQRANIRIGMGSGSVTASDTHYSIPYVSDAPQDLVAMLTDGSRRPLAMIVRRDLALGNGATITPTLNFSDTAEAFSLSTANVTLSGLSSQQASLSSQIQTVHGTLFGLSVATGLGNGQYQFVVVPAAKQAPSDLYQLMASVNMGLGSTGLGSSQYTGVFVTGAADQTLSFGPALSTVTVSDTSVGYDRPRVILASQSPYDRGITAWFQEYDLPTVRLATITVSRNYYGKTPAVWDVSFPNLHGVDGWDDSWGLQDSHVNHYGVSAYGGKATTLDDPPKAGTRFLGASRTVGMGYTAASSKVATMRGRHASSHTWSSRIAPGTEAP